MNSLSYLYNTSSCVSSDQLKEGIGRLTDEIAHLSAHRFDYNSEYASLFAPFDKDLQAEVKKLVEKKKKLNPTMLIVIGIGGSNLGTYAVHQALNGTLYNQTTDRIKVYFADTVDADYISRIAQLMKKELVQGGTVLLNVVTKSGTTTETIANFELLFTILQEHKQSDAHNYVVVTTDEGSALWHFAQEHQFDRLASARNIGGRYSVFSAVGQFPLILLGIDVDQLLAGAQNMVERCTQPQDNLAAIRAALLAAWYNQGFTIHNSFIFSVDLEGIGSWYRQLMAESIGKMNDKRGNCVQVGITPIVSIGTKDLHSVAQLYLSGPYNTATTFITVQQNRFNLAVPQRPAFDQLVTDLQGRTYATLMDAVVGGVKKAYSDQQRPFDELHVPNKSAYSIGQLMQLQMVEIMYVGFLFGINPFDQPQVELYKAETKRLLRNG